MSRPHVSARLLPRVAIFGLIGVAVASCSDSGRFGYTNTSSRQAPSQEVTGSVAPRSAPTGRVVAQPLPVPSAPATVASNSGYGYQSGNGSSSGAQGLGAYRPGAPVAQAAPVYQQPAPTYQQAAPVYTQPTYAQPDITGSVPHRPIAAAPPPPPKPSGAWTWDGGSPITVGHGETAEAIARKHGVPVAALLQTNGIRHAADIKPGQRLVIPRYVTNTAPQAAAPRVAAPQVAAAAPITRPVVSRQPNLPAPQLAQPRTVPSQQVATIPAQSARMATPEPEKAPESAAKTAEPAGAMQTFRWPVKGRVIAGFGPKPNGAQNDGINLAVPEGTPVKAADDGVVAYAGNELKGYGNLVLIRHSNGFVSAYAHASELMVKRGDTIKRGQVIANAGQTGNVTSPQLHFEIRKGSTPVDPTKYLSGG